MRPRRSRRTSLSSCSSSMPCSHTRTGDWVGGLGRRWGWWGGPVRRVPGVTGVAAWRKRAPQLSATHLLKVLYVERLHAGVHLQCLQHSIQHLGKGWGGQRGVTVSVCVGCEMCAVGGPEAGGRRKLPQGARQHEAGWREAGSARSWRVGGRSGAAPHPRTDVGAQELAQAQHPPPRLKLGAAAAQHGQEGAERGGLRQGARGGRVCVYVCVCVGGGGGFSALGERLWLLTHACQDGTEARQIGSKGFCKDRGMRIAAYSAPPFPLLDPHAHAHAPAWGHRQPRAAPQPPAAQQQPAAAPPGAGQRPASTHFERQQLVALPRWLSLQLPRLPQPQP
jgi:hypothetical protein